MSDARMELSGEDAVWVGKRLPRAVLDAMMEFRGKCFVAGGFIRSCIAHEEINDIDLFAPNKEVCNQIVGYLRGAVNVKKDYVTDNATTLICSAFPFPIQIIHRWCFDTPAACISSFDFTIARAAAWFDEERVWKTECDARFYQDLAAKRLQYCCPMRIEECGGSMLRVIKFLKRGYYISPESLSDVAVRWMSGVGPSVLNFKDSEQQIAKVMSGLLREVDPNTSPFDRFIEEKIGA